MDIGVGTGKMRNNDESQGATKKGKEEVNEERQEETQTK
jgi:hypothetical protein